MRRRLLIPLIVALGLGLLAGALVMRQSARTTPATEKREQTVQIAVMAKELTRGVKLEKGDTELRDWPERLASPDYIRSLSEAEGRIIVFNMVKGEPLLRSKLAAEDSVEGLSTLIPGGRRAFTIRVNDVTGVAGFLLPGSRVDVYATFDMEVPSERGTGTRKTPVTQAILQNVEVLAAGGVQEAGKKKSGVSVPMVTLLLTPQESAKLALAGTSGSLWLSMRNPRDKALAQINPVTVDDVFRRSSAPPPAQAAPAREKPAGTGMGGESLSGRIPQGRRAFSISVTDVTGVAGFLLPGNRVDVHGTFEIEVPRQNATGTQKTTVTRTILQDIEVLAAGGVRETGAAKDRIPVAVVTLLVSPAQSDRLALASAAGKLWLSLRNPLDKENEELKPVGVTDLLREGRDKGGSAPRPPGAAKPYSVEIIQGGKKSKAEF
ncbi:MAG: Flp pilus assembly protein CpaB [Candidatus Tectomicrobia bacterium]|nr:Flp pilus assembly protein CpaB [Candidatus Tectomicrobia bacterium]